MTLHLDSSPRAATTCIQRRAYQPPRLSALGDVCSLTETGSMAAMEDNNENGMCMNANTTGNMC